MADTKITALAAIATVDPAADVLPIVDISDTSMAASGTTKKVTTNQILGAGGTATLASASITGDLTVATDAFKVISATKDVCIGTVTPTFNNKLTVVGGGGGDAFITSGNGTRTGYIGTDGTTVIMGGYSNHTLRIQANDLPQMQIAPLGIFDWYDGAGGTRMTLNSTGLGIGVASASIGARLHSKAGAVTLGGIIETGGASSLLSFADVGTSSYTRVQIGSIGNTLVGMINGVQAMTLDASGSLLIGTTSATVGATAARLHLSADGTDRWAVGPQSNSQHFIIQASNIYGVYLSSLTATSWSSASDERLKDVIEPISNAVSKVGSLRAVIGKFKSDKTNTRKPFLMAQDVLAVLPEAVDVSKPDQFGLAYTDVIPLLVAAIKELTARVQTLEAR